MKSHFREKLYLSSPTFIQNILVSVAGIVEHNRRYGGEFLKNSSELMGGDYRAQSEWISIQNELLKKTLTNAVTSVPFYKKLCIDKVDINEFPILERSSIVRSVDDFISNKYSKKNLDIIYTGGSTGSPLPVYLNKSVRRKSYAFWDRFYKNIGFNIGQKKATFLGRKIQNPENYSAPFWRYNIIDKQLLFSTYHMTNETLPQYIKKLNDFRPDLIEGYPFTVYQIALFIVEKSIVLNFIPKGISVSSENLGTKQREIIEKAFTCKVFDQYGSAETVVFAGDCEYGNKHFSTEYGLAEVITSDGTILREGEGEILVTGFVNDVMPLIRYRIGDLGRISYRSCPCGRTTPILEELSGKVSAVVISEGRSISTAAIAFAFEYLRHIKKAQVVQSEHSKICVNIVTTVGFTSSEEEFMLWELEKMLGKNMKIEVKHVDDIPVGSNGKFQMVVQNYYSKERCCTYETSI